VLAKLYKSFINWHNICLEGSFIPWFSLKFSGGFFIMVGSVKWFNSQKGFGFITTEEGREIFVHYSAIEDSGFKTLEEGAKVEFDLAQGPKGDQAVSVKKE
jgi:CspA family cold shock protein